MTTEDKIEQVLAHISNVQRNAYKLGMKLIRGGEVKLGQNLIANGQVHDNSKLRGIEFQHLFWGSELLKETIAHHQSTNPHHPEFWESIHEMPEVYLAEMACDVLARAQEFGQDVREWLSASATKKYGFSMEDPCGRQLSRFIDMLTDKSFSELKKDA
jgi:hypothetical protein